MSAIAVNKIGKVQTLLSLEYLMKQSDDKETRYKISEYESKDKITQGQT